MNFLHRVACCCEEPGGDDSGTALTDCIVGLPTEVSRISFNVSVSPKMMCPIVDHDYVPWDICSTGTIPTIVCYNQSSFSCTPYKVTGSAADISVPVFASGWGAATASYGGWSLFACGDGTPPCWCVGQFKTAEDCSYVAPFTGDRTGSPQFDTICDPASGCSACPAEWNSNPKDPGNNLKVTLVEAICCGNCICNTGTVASTVVVSIEATWTMDIPTIEINSGPCLQGGCVDIPYVDEVYLAGETTTRTRTHTQTAYVYFERQMFSSQTTVRMSRGDYTIREVITVNPCALGDGVDLGYSGPSCGCTATLGGSFTQDLGCTATGLPAVSPGLSDAGFTITCRVD